MTATLGCGRCGAEPGAPHMLVDCDPAAPTLTLDVKLQALLDHVVLTLLEHARESGKALHEADMITLALVNLANTVRSSARHIVEGFDLDRRMGALQQQNRRAVANDVGGFGVSMLSELVVALESSGRQVPTELISMLEKAASLFNVPSSMPSAFAAGVDVKPGPLGAGCAGGACDQCDGIVRSQLGPISGMDPCQCDCHRKCDHLYDPDVADGPCLLCQQPRGGDAPAQDATPAEA